MRKTVIISIVVMVSCFEGIAETDSLVSNGWPAEFMQ